MDTFPNANLTGFPVSPDQSRCRYESIHCCETDSNPPVRSSSICQIDHPLVDLFLRFATTCGVNLTSVTTSFTYESA